MNLLFVCSRNRKRSATAETVFSDKEGVHAIGAGINPDSPTVLSGDLIEWADHIFVMEQMHKKRLTKKYDALLKNKRLSVLGIPDNYEYMDPDLVHLFESKLKSILQ